jgi:hypothetical protein
MGRDYGKRIISNFLSGFDGTNFTLLQDARSSQLIARFFTKRIGLCVIIESVFFLFIFDF